MRCLKWPQEQNSQEGLTIMRDDHSKIKRLVKPASFDEARDDNLAVSECGSMLQKLVDNVQALLRHLSLKSIVALFRVNELI
jgi:hypothetical protein